MRSSAAASREREREREDFTCFGQPIQADRTCPKAGKVKSAEGNVQVGIIRQVEVELDNTLRDLRDSHKEEASKLKKWRALNKDVQAKLAEFQLQGELSWRHSLASLPIAAVRKAAQYLL